MTMTLHGYFRSSAAWRVRIALGLKGVAYANAFHHLRRDEQTAPDYLAINPQGLVPALGLEDGQILTQSLAICEYLDETLPGAPLLPSDPIGRAHVRAFAQAIACDIHPVQNLKVLRRLRAFGIDQDGVNSWAHDVVDEGLNACADLLGSVPAGPFCFGDAPTLADICLVPQMSNARRFGVNVRWQRLLDIEANCAALPAFANAEPSAQPDAED
jgi:maleylpyruvate isomerase